MSARSWIWYDGASHRARGLGMGKAYWINEMWEERHGRPYDASWASVSVSTACGLTVDEQVGPDSVLADALQPKMRPVCPTCEAAA